METQAWPWESVFVRNITPTIARRKIGSFYTPQGCFAVSFFFRVLAYTSGNSSFVVFPTLTDAAAIGVSLPFIFSGVLTGINCGRLSTVGLDAWEGGGLGLRDTNGTVPVVLPSRWDVWQLATPAANLRLGISCAGFFIG